MCMSGENPKVSVAGRCPSPSRLILLYNSCIYANIMSMFSEYLLIDIPCGSDGWIGG